MTLVTELGGRSAIFGMVHGPARGLENPDELIGQLIEAGADALMVS